MNDERIIESFVDQNTSANGTLKTQGDVRIGGLIEGQIVAKGRTQIDQTGKLRGEIQSREALIEGSVKGSIEASEKVFISETSSIQSNVVAPHLVVEIGASLQGYFIITPDQAEREKLKKNIETDYSKPNLQNVTFSAPFPEAKEVKLVGNFTDWDETKAIPLKKTNNGVWKANVQLLPDKYEYLFLVDGEPLTDPNNPRKVKNSYGGENSVLTIDHEMP